MQYESHHGAAAARGIASSFIAGAALFSMVLGPGFVLAAYIVSGAEFYDPWQRLALTFASLPLHLLAFCCAYSLTYRNEVGQRTNSRAAVTIAGISLAVALFVYWALTAFFPVFFPYAYL